MVDSKNNKPLLSSLDKVKKLSFEDFKKWDLDNNYQGNIDFFTFVLLVIKAYYKYKLGTRTIHPKYTNSNVEYTIPTEKGVITVTSGMLKCFEEFYLNKLAKLTKVEKQKLIILKEELLEVDNSTEKIEIEAQISELENIKKKKMMELPGFKAMLITAKGDRSYLNGICLLYTSPSPRDGLLSRMPSSA